MGTMDDGMDNNAWHGLHRLVCDSLADSLTSDSISNGCSDLLPCTRQLNLNPIRSDYVAALESIVLLHPLRYYNSSHCNCSESNNGVEAANHTAFVTWKVQSQLHQNLRQQPQRSTVMAARSSSGLSHIYFGFRTHFSYHWCFIFLL